MFQIYGSAADQKINFDKSAIAFSPNPPMQLRNEVCSFLHIQSVYFHDKYLGLPTVIGWKKIECFNCIKEKLRKKLNGWKELLLSKAEKSILINAVAQCISNYAMVFKVPVTLCAELNSMVSEFSWNSSANYRGISWLRWEHLFTKR